MAKQKNKVLEKDIPCDSKQVRPVMALVREFVADLPFNDEDMMNIELITNEAVSNAITHGSAGRSKKDVQLRIEINQDQFIMTIKDFGGKKFNPDYFEKIAVRKNWGKGGRGIYLMKLFMDEFVYIVAPDESTSLYLAKNIPNG
jgi:anti-sigma regulatory factor (Ser/Thr protein kinase)